MSTGWRAKQLGHQLVLNNHDLANAFGSTTLDTLEQANAEIVRPEDAHFGLQRVLWTSIGLPLGGDGGEALARPGCGAPMGDPYAVHSFTRSFAPCVRRWQMGCPRYNDEYKETNE